MAATATPPAVAEASVPAPTVSKPAPVSPEQIAIVKATVPVLQQHGEAITASFYASLLEAHPALRNMFSASAQAQGRQQRALAGAVLAYASHIDNLPALGAAVTRIAHKHVALGVQPEQYAVVGTFLLQAIVDVLGAAATPEILDAWAAAYGALADVFVGVEKGLYNATHGWEGWRRFRIARKVAESETIASFYFEPVESTGQALPSYLPGQYLTVRLPVPALDILQCRHYSLSEAPGISDGKYYRISAKREPTALGATDPGIVSNILHDNCSVGDEIELSHPQGDFFMDPTDRSKEGVPVVLISGGVGVTPMIAILRSLTSTAKETPAVNRPVSWIHASKTSAVMPFSNAIQDICSKNDNVTTRIYLDELSQTKEEVELGFTCGRLDLAKLDHDRDLFLLDKNTEYMICGPERFMVDMKKALLEMGVSSDKINSERYAVGGVPDS